MFKLNRLFSIFITLTLCTLIWGDMKGLLAADKFSKGNFEVTPETLGALVASEKVDLMLRDGTYSKGKVINANTDEITLRVKKVEPKNRLARPQAII